MKINRFKQKFAFLLLYIRPLLSYYSWDNARKSAYIDGYDILLFVSACIYPISFFLQVKLLLLGAGESGKSTFLKQMRILYGQDYDETDLLDIRPTIYQNMVKGMKVLFLFL